MADGLKPRRLPVSEATRREDRFGIGKDAVGRIWSDHNLKPWKVEVFKVSTDP